MRISKEKQQKISEQILQTLFLASPRLLFTAQISREIARDEEFVKKLLLELKTKKLVLEVKKNKDGIEYSRRQRWRLPEKVYQYYKNK